MELVECGLALLEILARFGVAGRRGPLLVVDLEAVRNGQPLPPLDRDEEREVVRAGVVVVDEAAVLDQRYDSASAASAGVRSPPS